MRMTASEQILARILADADAAGAELLEKAKAQADELLEQARQEIEAQQATDAAQAQQQCAGVLRAAHSAAALIERNVLLVQRRTEIEDTLTQVLTRLDEMPAEEYFALLLKLIRRTAQPGEGTLILSARDAARMPASFETALRKLPDGCQLTLGEPSAAAFSGFVLRYADIEMNCRFDALLEERRDELEDLVNSALFAG